MRSAKASAVSSGGWLPAAIASTNFRGQERQPQQSSDVAGADAPALSNFDATDGARPASRSSDH